MAGFGGTIKLEGAKQYISELKNIATELRTFSTVQKQTADSVNTSGRSLKDVEADLKKVAAQQKLTNAEYDKSDKSLSAYTARAENLTNKLKLQREKLALITKELTDLRAERDKEKKTLDEIESTYGKASTEYQKQAKVVADLETKIKKTEAAQTSAQAAVVKSEKEAQKLSATMEKTADATDDLGNKTEEAGKKAKNAADGGFTVFKGVLANLATDAIRRVTDGLKTMASNVTTAGISFDSAMSQVEAVSGAAGKELDALTEKAKEMGAKTKFSATESAEAFNYMAMAGWKTEDMLNGIEGIMNLAAASGSDLATTSDIVTDALTAMGYAAGDAGRLADVMAAASSNANTNVEMMGQTFQYAAPIVGALGYNMEDTAVAIGLMANAGIKGEKAGTALRSVLTRLSAPPAECAKAMKKLGISITDSGGKMKPLGTIIDDLRKAFDGLSESEQTQLAKNLAGQEAMSGLLAIVNAAPADYEKLTKAVENSSGAAEKMANVMNDNVGGKLTLLKSQLEGIYLTIWKQVEPSITKALDKISKALEKVNWEDFGKFAGEALEKVGDGLAWIIDNKELVVGALTAITGAFAIKKVGDFGSGLISTTKALASFVKPASTAAAATSAVSTAASGAATATAGAAAKAGILAKAFGALSGPVGVAVAGVTAVVGVMVAYANSIERGNTQLNKNLKATERLAKGQQDLTKTIEENREAREENSKSANKELEDTDALIYRLDILSKKEKRNASEKKEMKAIVEKLNELVPDLALAYDEEKDALSQNTSKIEANVEARKHLNSAEAERTNLSGITEEMTQAESELAKAVENNTTNEKAYIKAKKDREAFEKKYTTEQIANNVALQIELARLLNTEEQARKNYEKSSEVVKNYQDTLGGLKGEYEKTADAAADFERRANIAPALEEIATKAKKAGIEIPKQLTEGIEEGRYTVPKTIAELKKLINFDQAIIDAGLAGIKIPESISQGLLEGKYNLEEAMRQVKEITSLADKAEQMYNDGYYVSQNLADGIRSGKISVEEANKELQAEIDFANLVLKAKEDGAAVPTNLGQGIREGTVTAQEAVQQMKDSITFSELSQKATQAGIEIPQFLADQITAGEIKPADAVQRMQALLDYRKSLDDAGLAGVAIPEEFTEGILSGEYSVTDTIATLNGWVQFKKAIADTDAAGREIPKQLAANILAGKTSPQDAVKQMNNWVKFEDALKTTKYTGKEIPQEFADMILSGKIQPEQAVRTLNQLMQKEALNAKKSGEEGGKAFDDGLYSGLTNSQKQKLITGSISSLGGKVDSTLQGVWRINSPSKTAAALGGYYLDGVNQGISNRDKRKGIFSSIASFGNSLLSGLKSALKENSPSKATKEMGVNLLKGLGIGIEDEEAGVLKQVKDLGENMLGTLDGSLAGGLSADTFQSLQNAIPGDFSANIGTTTSRIANGVQSANTGLVDQFKEALSQVKIVMDDEEMGRFVDKTVTDLVYN